MRVDQGESYLPTAMNAKRDLAGRLCNFAAQLVPTVWGRIMVLHDALAPANAGASQL